MSALYEPKRTAHTKNHKGSFKIASHSICSLKNLRGDTWITVNQPIIRFNSRHLETIRMKVSRIIKTSRLGERFWFCGFPDHSISAKPAEVRMGGGKGSHDHYEFRKGRGDVFMEFCDFSESDIKYVFHLINNSIPGKLKLHFNNAKLRGGLK